MIYKYQTIMKKIVTKLCLLLLPIMVLVIGATSAHAATGDPIDCNDQLSPAGKQIFCGGQSQLDNNKDVLQTVIDNIVNILVGLIGSILAIVILVSAIQIVTSSGSPDAMKSAKNRLAQAAISLGLLVSFRAILALLGI